MRSSHRLTAPLTVVATVLLVVQASTAASPALPSTTAVSGARAAVTAPSSGALLGSYIQPTSYDRAGQEKAILTEEWTMGRRRDIEHWFYPWSSPFPTWREPWAAAGGRLNLISWAPALTTDVNAGRHDAMIDARARSMKALGRPVLLRWFAEMDGGAKRSQAVSPAAFIAAWRRVYNRFQAQGATNVEFVWCPTAWNFKTGAAPQWYPGDAYVQWLCADGYNWAPTKPGAEWTSFGSTFDSFYAWAAPRGKPIMIGEVGAIEDWSRPGRKGDWIRSAAATITRWPAVKAFVWFDAQAVANSEPRVSYNWRVDTSASSRQAWNDIGRWAHFNP